MDRRNSREFFLRRRVCTLSDSFCGTTDLSLFSVNELLSFLVWPSGLVHIHALAGLTHVAMLCITQLHRSTLCILVVTPVLYIVPCTLLAKFDVVILAVAPLPWHTNLANKLSKRRGVCTIVLHCTLYLVFKVLKQFVAWANLHAVSCSQISVNYLLTSKVFHTLGHLQAHIHQSFLSEEYLCII